MFAAFPCRAVDQGRDAPGLNSLPEVEFTQLSQTDRSAFGAKALAIHPGDWKHGETAHFIYHYQKNYVATAVSVESEFHFRVIEKVLAKADLPWTEKAHIYIFERAPDWESFQTAGALEPWTGGIQSGGNLFIVRNPAFKFTDNSLGHEIAHLVLGRTYGEGVPLWLNEGFAQFVSKNAHASYQRARGYLAKARSEAVAGEKFFPLARLTTMTYPAAEEVETFYNESERLVRFLVAADRDKFLELMERLAKGERFSEALSSCYGSRFTGLDAMEGEFRLYAAKDGVTAVREF
jgi:hypothetical protein